MSWFIKKVKESHSDEQNELMDKAFALGIADTTDTIWMIAAKLMIRVDELQKHIVTLEDIVRLVEPKYQEDGRVKKVCMRPLCHQSILVREYQRFDDKRPLFCSTCWYGVFNDIDLIMHMRNKTSFSDRMAIKEEVINKLLHEPVKETSNADDEN